MSRRRAWSRLAAFAAMTAIALQALWPLIVEARPRIPGELVPICTVDGVTHYLELPAVKTPLEQRSASHGEHCKLCVFASERAVLPGNVFLAPVIESSTEVKPSTAILQVDSPQHPPAQPRGPPAAS